MRTFNLLFLLLISFSVQGQNAEKSFTLLPDDRLFQPLLLDPNETQAYGSIVAYWENGDATDLVYLPFGLGFYKGLVRWGREGRNEIGFGGAVHTQFEWTFEGKSERNFKNADYRVSSLWHHRVSERHSFRVRFFHVSSHLGDDYILRNHITSYFPNPNNYEQLDFTWSAMENGLRYYGGVGMVVRPNTIRKRFSSQAGIFYDKPIRSKWPLGFFIGGDVKILAENDFNPGLKIGTGLRVGEATGHPLRFMVEFYRGNLPYSPFESTRVQWLGVGVYFST